VTVLRRSRTAAGPGTSGCSLPFVAFALVGGFLVSDVARSQNVERWDRYTISLPNATYSGNAFELEVDATFTHTSSSTEITMPGYYAGSNTWKVDFMPTLTGGWTWTTSSPDADLNGKTGSLNCISSARKPPLIAEEKKWRRQGAEYVIPIGVFIYLSHGAGTTGEVEALADFLAEHNVNQVNFRICEADLCWHSVAAKTFDLPFWETMIARVQELADHDIGVSLMLYSDDSATPTYAAMSDEEQLLIRYTVARFAAFPWVLWNSGIDIREYRGSGAWNDWYGALVKSLDPYGHPVSSRPASSRDLTYMEDEHTFNSNGRRNSTIATALSALAASSTPMSNDDNFGEDKTDVNGHTPSDIRRAGSVLVNTDETLFFEN
jgi:hypothetical protein